VLDGANASLETCRAIASQPNIIHSWEKPTPVIGRCHSNETYGQVRPLPGRPLWQTVNDPVSRFLMVDRWTKDQVRRLRVDSDGERLFTVGATLAYHFLPPDRLPDGYLEEICAMVAAGGTVAATHVRFNLQRAHLIGYVQEKGVIVANSSLKNPRPEYIDSGPTPVRAGSHRIRRAGLHLGAARIPGIGHRDQAPGRADPAGRRPQNLLGDRRGQRGHQNHRHAQPHPQGGHLFQ
jgi:hypothetical protein